MSGKGENIRYDLKLKQMKFLGTLKFLVALLVASMFSVDSKAEDLSCRFEKFFLKGDMVKWERLVDSLQKVKIEEKDEETLLYAEYGLIGYQLANKQKEKAEIQVLRFEKHLNRMLQKEPHNANFLAFDAALVGFKIALQPWKAPIYGSQSKAKIEKAMKYRKNEIMPITEMANAYYFRPNVVGGDKQKAMELYEKAFSLHGEKGTCNWRYYSNGAWLGQVYTKLGDTKKAKDLYLKLLAKAPDFQFVKDELLPQLEQGKFKDYGGQFERLID